MRNSSTQLNLSPVPTASPAETIDQPKSEETSESTATKARKPRAKGKKPKTVTLAEVRSLTSNSDRAIVWSQVGPGKFVRQGGATEGDAADSDSVDENTVSESSQPMMIEATGKRVATTSDNDESDFE